MRVQGERRGRSFFEMKATPSGFGGKCKDRAILFLGIFIEHWPPYTSCRGELKKKKLNDTALTFEEHTIGISGLPRPKASPPTTLAPSPVEM